MWTAFEFGRLPPRCRHNAALCPEAGRRAGGEAPVNWKRLTVLDSLGLDGVVTMTTVTTGTTIPVFLDILQTTLLPVLREHKCGAILVMDNRSAYRN